jgi:CRISPR-associated protein Csd1
MIIESLSLLHSTLVEGGVLPSTGFQRVKLRYVIELSEQGSCVAVTDYAKGSAASAWFAVPCLVMRGSAIKANLLWDDCEYTLGVPRCGSNFEGQSKAAERRHQAFLDRIWSFAPTVGSDPGLDAVLRFYSQGSYRDWAGGRLDSQGRGHAAISFRLQGDRGLICERPALRDAIQAAYVKLPSPCSIRAPGSVRKRSRANSLLRDLPGGENSATDAISFDLSSTQVGAFPPAVLGGVNLKPVPAHVSAVNWLLGGSRQMLPRLGRLTLLCWQEGTTSQDAAELVDRTVFSGSRKSGKCASSAVAGAGDVSFLGLVGRGQRASAVFYRRQTRAALVQSLERWERDLDLHRADGEAEGIPGIVELIQTLTFVGDENGHHQMQIAIALLQAAIFGEELWDNVLTQALRRVKRPGPDRDRHLATALVKLALTRNHKVPLLAQLDTCQRHGSYRLGRLFAVLDYLQTLVDASGSSAARGQFWSAFLKTPKLGLRVPLRMADVYLSVLPPAPRRVFNELLKDLTKDLANVGVPAKACLMEQSLAAIGCFHQMTVLSEFVGHMQTERQPLQLPAFHDEWGRLWQV